MQDNNKNETGSDLGAVHATATQAIGSVLICGYGVMGQGVAMTFAAAGFRTAILSRRADSLANLPFVVVKDSHEQGPLVSLTFQRRLQYIQKGSI